MSFDLPPVVIALLVLCVGQAAIVSTLIEAVKALVKLFDLPAWWSVIRRDALRVLSVALGVALGLFSFPATVSAFTEHDMPASLAALAGAGTGASAELVYRWFRDALPSILARISGGNR